MQKRIEILAGLAGSGKTTQLLIQYRDALHAGLSRQHPGTTLWLAPTNRAAGEVRDRLLDGSLPAVFRSNVATFDDFADQVLKSAPQAVTGLSLAMQRILLRRIVAELSREKQLVHFQKIAGTSGFLDLVSAFISELKRSHTWPEEFEAACAARVTRQRDRELGLIYTRYQAALVAGGVYDGEGRFWSAGEALAAGHWGRFAELSLVVIDGFTDFTEAQYEIIELLSQKADRLLVSLFNEDPLVRSDLFAKTTAVIARLQEAAKVDIKVCQPEAQPAPASCAGSPSHEPGQAAPGPAAAAPARRTNSEALPLAIEHLTRHLFANPRQVAQTRDVQGIEAVAIAGQGGEVNLLAARIKRLLLEGVVPGSIVVAVRDLDGYADLIDEIFSAAGIPFACEAGRPLSRLAPFKALLNVLSMELEDWPFRRLMALLDSSLFRPDWAEFSGRRAARDVAAELRRAELDEGRERILTSLARVTCDRVPPDSRPPDSRPADPQPAETSDELPGAPVSDATSAEANDLPEQTAARRANSLLQKLSDATIELRRPHRLDGWSKVVATLAREFGFDRAPLDESVALDASTPEDDRHFGAALAALLFDAARAEKLSGVECVPVTLREFVSELTDLLNHQRLAPRQREEGRVRVLSAEQVRNLDVPYLFLAGLTESSFPRHRGDDCLYGEGERRELNRLGLALGNRALRAQEELLMFYGIVTRARKQLVLTYPSGTPNGQPLSPSPYLAALIELFDPKVFQSGREEQLDPVPKLERVLSRADARVRGMSEALAGRPALFRAVCDDPIMAVTAVNCVAAIDMNIRRFHTPGLTNFEGLLENPRNIEVLGQRYSPEHEFSATQLEAYAQCPFRFLLQQVLKVESPATPDIETDYGRRGTLVHEVLAELHRLAIDQYETAGEGPQASRGEDVAELFQRLLDDKLRNRPPASEVHEALQRIERRLLQEWGEAYGRQWDEFVAGLPRDAEAAPLPTHFETSFGTVRRTSQPAAASTNPLVFGAGAQAVRVAGRIDRIDVGQAGNRTVFTVIDYKTGRRRTAKIDSIDSGRALQIALYTLAVVRLEIVGSGAVPWQMGYWHVSDTGFASAAKKGRLRPGDPLPPIEEAVWEALVTTLEEIVPRLAAGIRAGRFAVFNQDPHCGSNCEYNTVCRVAQIRTLPPEMRKEWTP